VRRKERKSEGGLKKFPSAQFLKPPVTTYHYNVSYRIGLRFEWTDVK